MSTTLNSPITAVVRQHPWDVVGVVPEKMAAWEYGWVINGQTVGGTRDRLIDAVERKGAEITFVWTPETPEPVLVEQVPFLVDAFRKLQAREARHNIMTGAALAGIGLLLAIGLEDVALIYRGVFFVVGAVILTEGLWKYWRVRQYTPEDAASDASTGRFTAWLKSKGLSGYSITIAACIIVVGLVQALNPDWLNAAALVKPAVKNGEIWRLFTATLMHANVTHFWMNMAGLFYFSRIVDQTLHRAYVPLVFLIAGGLGSVFSVVLYPNSSSVGASGGLMGLLGFITMAAYFNRTKYPPRYLRQLIEAIAFVGVFGLFGFAFIDNAGHLGGLAGGLILGWIFLRGPARERLLQIAGAVSLLVLILTGVIAIQRLLP